MKPYLVVYLLIAFSIMTGCKSSVRVQKEHFTKECISRVTPQGNFPFFQEMKKSYCECMWEHAVSKLSSKGLDSVWSQEGIRKLKAMSGACDIALQEQMHSFGFPTRDVLDSIGKHRAEILKNSEIKNPFE